MNSHHEDRPPQTPRGISRVRLILPVLAFGLFAGCIAVLMRTPSPARPAGEVAAEIHETVLRRAGENGGEDGGPVGPWWVAAESIDETSGQLQNFRLASGTMRVAARAVRLVIDPTTDTFSFELFDVALTRLPGKADADEGSLLSLEHHVLGPIRYGQDIASDATHILTNAAAPESDRGLASVDEERPLSDPVR